MAVALANKMARISWRSWLAMRVPASYIGLHQNRKTEINQIGGC